MGVGESYCPNEQSSCVGGKQVVVCLRESGECGCKQILDGSPAHSLISVLPLILQPVLL